MATGLSGYRTKTDLVYEHLRGAVLAGRYAPGDRIVLDQLAAELGVSKVPVREAVTRLVGEGWLDQRAHVGPVVPSLRPEEVRETAVIRAALEETAVREAVPHHDERSLAEVRRVHSRMADEIGATSDRFPTLNVDLHAALIAPCPYPQLRQLTLSMMERTLRYQTVRRVSGYRDQAHEEHGRLIEAVAAGDTDLAARLARDHVLTAAEQLRDQLTAGR